MHYALVADLMPREEFDERVWKKCDELGNAVDETTAAMLVLEDLGRAHIRIGDIARSRTEIVCFFGKVIEKDGPKIFDRKDGEEGEQGVVANLVLGDPTGTIQLTLWDSVAASADEIKTGDVLEVVAKPRGGGKATCCALRESIVEIVETKRPPKVDVLDSPLEVRILAVMPVREIIKRDGSTAALQEFLAGDSGGTMKITTWNPELFEEVSEGDSISISSLRRREDNGVVDYSTTDGAEILHLDHDVEVKTIDPGEVVEGKNPVVSGEIVSVTDLRPFTTRRGAQSCVRNLKISGSRGSCFAAVWGDAAREVYCVGEKISVINADAKINRYGEVELTVGFNSCVRIASAPAEFVRVSGLIILREEGLTLDDGKSVWLLSGAIDDCPIGLEVQVCGYASRGKIEVGEWGPISGAEKSR